MYNRSNKNIIVHVSFHQKCNYTKYLSIPARGTPGPLTLPEPIPASAAARRTARAPLASSSPGPAAPWRGAGRAGPATSGGPPSCPTPAARWRPAHHRPPAQQSRSSSSRPSWPTERSFALWACIETSFAPRCFSAGRREWFWRSWRRGRAGSRRTECLRSASWSRFRGLFASARGFMNAKCACVCQYPCTCKCDPLFLQLSMPRRY